MDRKLQRHRADSLRQHGFLVFSLQNMLNYRTSTQHTVHRCH